MTEKENIILIGMSGAGKSTLGVLLAKAAGMDFIDTDILIQQAEKRMLQDIVDKEGVENFLSLEERMACGVGVCLGCVAKTTKKDEHSQVNNARVCVEGPVFAAEDVEL